MFAVHTKCQLHRSHQKRCVDLKTPNACLESLALVSAHVNNDFVHPTIFGSRYDICACHQILLKPPMDNATLAMLAKMQREAR